MFRSFILIKIKALKEYDMAKSLNPFVQVFYSNMKNIKAIWHRFISVLIPLFRSFILMCFIKIDNNVFYAQVLIPLFRSFILMTGTPLYTCTMLTSVLIPLFRSFILINKGGIQRFSIWTSLNPFVQVFYSNKNWRRYNICKR